MAEQNLESRFWDTCPPSAQVASFLIKQPFLFQPTLVSEVLAFKRQAAEREFGNISNIISYPSPPECKLLRAETWTS